MTNNREKKKKVHTFCMRIHNIQWDARLETLPKVVYVRMTEDDVRYARQSLLKLPPTAPITYTLDYLAYKEVGPLLKDYYGCGLDDGYAYEIVQDSEVPADAELIQL